MKILAELPPIWDKLIASGLNPDTSKVIFTYGDTIYNPGNQMIPDHLVVHESTHSTQQGNDPEAWWGRYLADPYFRIQQEVEAYANQYKFICNRVKDRNQRFNILRELAGMLSGPTYGNIVLLNDALKMIKEKSGVRP